jgi:hypothetical protein
LSVPALCFHTVEFLKAENRLNTDGLFRISGESDVIKQLKWQFEEQGHVAFDPEISVHTVAGLLKLYFREMEPPLVPYARYEDFLQLARDARNQHGRPAEEVKLELRHACHVRIASLPPHNRAVLSYLMDFLGMVAARSDRNRMTPVNLAIVFAPNLIRRKEGLAGGSAMADANLVNYCIELLMDALSHLSQTEWELREKQLAAAV